MWSWVCALSTYSSLSDPVQLPTALAASGQTIRVPSGGNLQAALDAAQPGDTVLLAQGATYKGNFVLRPKSGTAFITVQTEISETGSLAAGVRLTPAAAAPLARIQSSNTMRALRTLPGAHHWRIQLVQFGPNDKGYGDIIELGDGSAAQNALSLVPYTLVLDRVYVYGDPLLGQKRGISINARDVTITNSTVRDIKGIGQDTQALCGYNGPGPFWIENNYLEASGENFMLGGADPSIPNLIPGGVTFRRNYVTKPLSWRSPILATPQGLSATVSGGGWIPPTTYTYQVVARRPAGADHVRAVIPFGARRGQSHGAGPGKSIVDGGPYRDRVSGISHDIRTGRILDRHAARLYRHRRRRHRRPSSHRRHGVVGEEPLRAQERTRPPRRAEHLREQLGGVAGRLCNRAVGTQLGGACTWCTIQNLEFRSNVVRHTASAIDILGFDDPARPSVPAANLNIHDNLFYDIDSSWGGTATFLQVGDAPLNVTVDHNTIDHSGALRHFRLRRNTHRTRTRFMAFDSPTICRVMASMVSSARAWRTGLRTLIRRPFQARSSNATCSRRGRHQAIPRTTFSARLQHALRQHSKRRLPSAAEQSLSPCGNGQPRSRRRHGGADPLTGSPLLDASASSERAEGRRSLS